MEIISKVRASLSGALSRAYNGINRLYLQLHEIDSLVFFTNSYFYELIEVTNMNIDFVGVQTRNFSVRGKNVSGVVIPLVAPLSFTSSDTTVATVKASTDGMSVAVSSTGKVGTATVTAKDSATGVQGVMNVNVALDTKLATLEFYEVSAQTTYEIGGDPVAGATSGTTSSGNVSSGTSGITATVSTNQVI